MPASVAFAFPGQGSQRVGMLDAMSALPQFEAALLEAEDRSGLPLRQLALDGPAEALADTRAAQPLLYLTDLAWAHKIAALGITPDFVAGHSLGEFAALAFADVFGIDEGLRLVTERARIMAEIAAQVPGTMAAVLGLERDAVASVIEDISDVWLANDNSATQAVLSGTDSGIERATEALTGAGARRIVPLAVAGPFHSPLMEPARAAFARILDDVTFSDASVPVLQNTDPSPERDASRLKERLVFQITSPVRWRETMSTLQDEGVSVLVETGPGAVLAGLARRLEGVTALSADADGLDRVLEVVGR